MILIDPAYYPIKSIKKYKLITFAIMIIIDDVLVSDHLLEVKFCCDLQLCRGICCVKGDAGAPLEDHEFYIIEDNIEQIKPYMSVTGKTVIETTGIFDYDIEGQLVTPLINDKECAFVYSENNVAFCAIEKAWLEKKIDFRKPISCHLYPIRINKLSDKIALNYHQWIVCNPARLKGSQLDLQLYMFLKEPLIRIFGKKWYNKLTILAEKNKRK